MSDGGKLHLGNKSNLLACLIDHSEYQSDAPVISNVIIDGAFTVLKLKPATVKNFDEYASLIFMLHLLLQFQYVRCVDLV